MARFQSKVILCVSILASLLTHSPTSLGQSLPAGVTAQIAQQFQNMPRDEQQAFAKQYGIELPAMAITRELSGSSIGAVGEQLEQIDVSEEEYTEEGLFDGADVPLSKFCSDMVFRSLIVTFRHLRRQMMHWCLTSTDWEWVISLSFILVRRMRHLIYHRP